MEVKTYNKLVRDNIPDIIEASGKKCKYSVIASDEDFKNALNNKLIEEVKEYSENPCIEELNDIMLVVNNLILLYGKEQVVESYINKNYERGMFEKRILLGDVISD